MARILIFAAGLIILPFFAGGYVLNLAVIIALTAMPALGLSLLMGYTGQISLGHASFYGLGAYFSALIAMRLGIDPWLAIIIATILVGAIGWALGWLVFRLHGHHLAMATLAFGLIVHVGFVEMKEFTGGPNGLPNIPALTFFGRELFTDILIYPVAWGACLIVMLVSQNLVRSPRGLSMRSVAENEAVAASIGQNVKALKRQILLISAVFASVSGGIYAHYIGYLSPNPFDVGFSIKLLVMVAIGGFANIWGVLFGVAFVTLLSELLKPLGFYDVVIFGLLLVTVMIFFPNGLLSGLVAIAKRAGARMGSAHP